MTGEIETCASAKDNKINLRVHAELENIKSAGEKFTATIRKLEDEKKKNGKETLWSGAKKILPTSNLIIDSCALGPASLHNSTL